MSSLSQPVTVDWQKLTKGSYIGCTVLTSEIDPYLSEGIALTVLLDFDETYVQFADIGNFGKLSNGSLSINNLSSDNYRYWQDVYPLVPWNANNKIKIGDEVFALFQNKDKAFSTVYYKAKIIKLPSKNFENITVAFSDYHEPMELPQTILIENVLVSTVIQRSSAQNTAAFFNAMNRSYKIKKNDTSQHSSSSKMDVDDTEDQCLGISRKCIDEGRAREFIAKPCCHYIWACSCSKCKSNPVGTTKCPICRKKCVLGKY